MLVAGSDDTTSGYDDTPGDEKGVAAMFKLMTGVDRYLLTFQNAVRTSLLRTLPHECVSCFGVCGFSRVLCALEDECG